MGSSDGQSILSDTDDNNYFFDASDEEAPQQEQLGQNRGYS